MKKLRYLLLLVAFLLMGCESQPTTKEASQEEEAIVYLHYDNGDIVEIETYVGAMIDLPLDLPIDYAYIFRGWFDGEGYYLGPTEVKTTEWVLESNIELFNDNYIFSNGNVIGQYIGDSDVLVIPYRTTFHSGIFDYRQVLDERDDVRVLYLPETAVGFPEIQRLDHLETLVFYPIIIHDRLTDYETLYVDPITNEEVEGLYLPYGYTSDMIYPGSLTNEEKACHVSSEFCKDAKFKFMKKDIDTPIGYYVSYWDEEEIGVFYYYLKNIWAPDEVLLEITLGDGYSQNQAIINHEAALKVYLESSDSEMTQYLVFDSSDPETYDSFENNTFKTNVVENTDVAFGHNQYRVFIVYESNEEDSFVLESMSLSAKSGDTVYGEEIYEDETYLFYISDYDRSYFRKDRITHGTSYNGTFNVIDGVAMHATFRLGAWYELRLEKSRVIGESQVQEIINSFECTLYDGSDIGEIGDEPMVFNQDCPITQIIQRNEGVFVPGQGTIYAFHVMISDAIYRGYERISADRIPNIDDIDYVVLPDYLGDEE